MKELFNMKGAEFSADRKYRYSLWRIWDESLPKVMCIGLNPSNANENKSDPTITHLTAMLKKLGYGGFYMMNLFALVSSKPQALLTHPNPIGENNTKLDEVAALCDEIIFCWGRFKQAEKRAQQISKAYVNALCFGKNKNGSPYHPLAMMYAGLTNKPKLIKY